MSNTDTQTDYNRNTDNNRNRNWLPLLLAPLLFYVGWMANDAARANDSQPTSSQNCPATTSLR